MRAIQITNLNGPDEALELVDIPEPEPSHMLTPGSGVVVDVHSAGVSFPEVLQTRGEYQIKPELPFVPGSEVGGTRRDTGERVAAFTMLGAFAEVAVAPDFMVFPIPGSWDYAQGAALVLNYHTAYFALKIRGRLAEGQTVLVHGAAGGGGGASIPGAASGGRSRHRFDPGREGARSAGDRRRLQRREGEGRARGRRRRGRARRRLPR